MTKQRIIAPAQVVNEPDRVSTTTRLKPNSEDRQVLEALGSWYAQEFLWVFKQRNNLGTGFNKDDRARLKRELTARGMSSRWAGAILTEALQAWRSKRASDRDYINSLKKRIAQIEYRLEPDNNKPYEEEELWFKYTRLNSLKAKLTAAQAQYATGRVKHVRGGWKLLNNRNNLEVSKYASKDDWHEAWLAARERCYQAPGEPGKPGGNETIRLNSDGYLEIKLPECLDHLSNSSYGRYRLNQPITFNYRTLEHRSASVNQRSIAYRVRYNHNKKAWYLDATFTAAYPERETDIMKLRKGNIIGVDLNKEHVSIAITNSDGNLLCKPFDIPFKLEGSAKHRDAQVRHLITLIIKLAKQYHASIAIEDLDFESDKTTSKETHSKQFRSTLHNLPVASFRTRLQGMTATAGIPLFAVDPAYTSKWGKAYWAEPLNVTTHQAAAYMIARRAYRFCLKRKNPFGKQSKNKGLTDSVTSKAVIKQVGEPYLQLSFEPPVGSRSETVTRVHQVGRNRSRPSQTEQYKI